MLRRATCSSRLQYGVPPGASRAELVQSELISGRTCSPTIRICSPRSGKPSRAGRYANQLPARRPTSPTVPRPRGTVADAHRQALKPGLRPVAASRHLTPAGRGWSTFGPRTGKQRWPSPDGAPGNNRMKLLCQAPPCEMVARGHRSLSRGCRCAASLRSVLSDQLFDCAAAAHGHAARRGWACAARSRIIRR